MWFPQVMYYPDDWVLGWGLGIELVLQRRARSTAGTAARWPGILAGVYVNRKTGSAPPVLTNSGTRGEHGPFAIALAAAALELWPPDDRAVAARAGAARRRPPAARPLVVGGQRVLFWWQGGALRAKFAAAPPGKGETEFERDGDGWRAARGRERGERLRVDGDQMIWAGYAFTRAQEPFKA